MSEIYPANKSEGCDNTHIIHCEVLGQRKHYCLCLHLINALERKDTVIYEECEKAIKGGTCEALQMRQQEKDADKALFYTPRKTIPKNPDDRPMAKSSSRPRFASVSSNLKKKPKPKPETEELLGADMSQVINESIKAERQAKPVLTKPMLGESPVQFAKRYQQVNG